MPFVLEGVFDENEPINAAMNYNLILELIYSNEGTEDTFDRIRFHLEH